MKSLNGITEKIFDVIEIYIPMAAFIVVFVTYIIVIIYRYVFYGSILWINELSTVAYIWAAILAASYGSRTDTHVVFSIVYDTLSEKAKLICRLIGNLFVFVTFCILFPRAYDFIIFMGIRKSPSIKILSFSVVYFPFLVFVALTIMHHAVLLIKDIKLSIAVWKGKAEI